MKIFKRWGIFLLAIFIISSCRSTKKIATAISKKDTSMVVILPHVDSVKLNVDSVADFRKKIFEKVNANYIHCDWFSAKVKLDYTDNSGQNNDATATIKILKDSIIWVSVYKNVVIKDFEGIRILITKDSVKLMDKLNKEITYRSISYLQEITQLPCDFKTLQDFILGNPVFFSNNIISYRLSENKIQALSLGSVFKHLITLDTSNNQIFHSKLDDADPAKSRTCDITFGNFQLTSGRIFAEERDITITEKAKLDIHLRFKQYNFDVPQTFPFNVPKSYTIK